MRESVIVAGRPAELGEKNARRRPASDTTRGPISNRKPSFSSRLARPPSCSFFSMTRTSAPASARVTGRREPTDAAPDHDDRLTGQRFHIRREYGADVKRISYLCGESGRSLEAKLRVTVKTRRRLIDCRLTGLGLERPQKPPNAIRNSAVAIIANRAPTPFLIVPVSSAVET